jgi:hypothetical protein
MPIWKITPNGPVRISETKLKREKILEEKLEDWVVRVPTFLGETLLIIGRQVMIPDVKDRLDVLALDPQGNAVVIELKRGKLKPPVDIQALRYASYISKWGFEDLERQARKHLGKDNDPDFNFNKIFEDFCVEAGVDDVPDMNSDQRIIIVGSEVKEKIGSVALWLLDHKVDVKVVEIDIYREGEKLFAQPQVIIPLPISRFAETGKAGLGSEGRQIWMTDGKTWHLEKRCGSKTREMVLKLDDIIRDNFDVDGPHWNQKFYISYRLANYNWLVVNTHPNMLRLAFLVKAESFNQMELAEQLGVEQFDVGQTLSEKFALPSSVLIESRNENVDRISLRIKEGFNLESDQFAHFLKETYNAFAKQ